MAEIKQIQVASTVYDIRDNRIITLTDAGSTTAGTWLASADGVTEYIDGQLYLYKVTVAGATTTYLNINNIGQKKVYRASSTAISTAYAVNSHVLLYYSSDLNGGSFLVMSDSDANSNTVPATHCTTKAATAAKEGTHTYYALTSNSWDLVTMRYANSSKTAITLNINSTGAKPIYINGTASSASNYTLPAGTYLTFYDGTAYHFRTDGKLPGTILNADSATKDSNGNNIYNTYSVVKKDGTRKRNIDFSYAADGTLTITTSD